MSQRSSQNSKKRVLIIGGSFGGLTAARTLGKKFDVTLVDRKEFFEFTPSFHYALQDNNYIDRITADLSNYSQKNKFTFIRGSLHQLNSTSAIISKSQTENINIQFDYCIIATGSHYASQVKSLQENLTFIQRKEQIINLISSLKNNCHKILVVGGGAVGVEIASICKDEFKQLDVHLWTKPAELLTAFPKRARRLAHNSLSKLGIKIEYGKNPETLPQQDYDYIFDCRGNINTPTFMQNSEFQQYLDSRNRIIVDDYYRLENHLNIYCIGDACINRNNEPKMSYNASIQGQYSAQNIIKTEAKSTSLKKMSDHPNIFAVTTGRRNGILCLGENIAFESCIVHYIKMMIEWVSCQSYKGSDFVYVIAYLQRQLLIFMAMIFNLINRKKHPPVERLTAYQKLQ